MGIHLMIFGALNTIGALAVPNDTTNAIGNKGTVGTCTAQGFLLYVTIMTACFYYCSFSVYSYVGIPNNFKTSAFGRLELYIHALVHVYPICSGFAIMSAKLFNNTGFGYCFVQSDPIDCGGGPTANDYLPCERGFDSNLKNQLFELLFDIPLYLAMIVPTVVMIALCFKVQNNQAGIQIQASIVAKQTAVYLLWLYLGIFPSALVHTLEYFGTDFMTPDTMINLSIFSNIMFTLFGLWSAVMYWYFSTDDPALLFDNDGEADADADAGNESGDIYTSSALGPDAAKENTGFMAEDSENEKKTGVVSSDTTTGVTAPRRPSVDQNSGSNRNLTRRSSGAQKRKYSFNIFDGTNATSMYAEFIYGCDSEDEMNEQQETEKWSTIQDHM